MLVSETFAMSKTLHLYTDLIAGHSHNDLRLAVTPSLDTKKQSATIMELMICYQRCYRNDIRLAMKTFKLLLVYLRIIHKNNKNILATNPKMVNYMMHKLSSYSEHLTNYPNMCQEDRNYMINHVYPQVNQTMYLLTKNI